jgi:putative sugar O-methyltransferase
MSNVTPEPVQTGDPPRAFLAENIDINPAAFERGLRLREEVGDEVDNRASYIEQNGLDDRFCYPDGNWKSASGNDYLTAYDYVRRGDYKVLNRLRFYGQVFSGYNAMTLQLSIGLHSVRDAPDDLDQWITANRSAAPYLHTWKNQTDGVPDAYKMRPPQMLGEHGWIVDGRVINHDTCVYQERITALLDSGELEKLKGARILEIGGGYGALARALSQMVGAKEYVICDLPESLLFSGLYLTLTEAGSVQVTGDAYRPTEGFVLLPNYKFHLLAGHFDIVINTISMAEMTDFQVKTYAESIVPLIGDSGVFFEQNSIESGPETSKPHAILPQYFSRNEALPNHRGFSQGQPFLRSNRRC